ncbi:MAG TPA: DUF6421 family protein [Solirubrobacteraceae bacterium]|nr:DUF6421 family protein [Solirubrobacteraceae bacterium]
MQGINVIFDEAHSEAWTIRPELAGQMQPVHPADASYARAAELLSGHAFSVAANTDALDSGVLRDCDLLVIAHPSDPRWERTTGIGTPELSPTEQEAIEAFVLGGGGLIVLGETEQDKYGNNVNELLARFDLRLRNDTVQDYEHCHGAPSWIHGELVEGGRGSGGDLLAGVSAACFYRTTTIESRNGARVLARTHRSASVPGAPLIVASEHGDGRVVVLGDSDLFGDDCIGSLDHATLWLNLVNWASRRAVRGWAGGPESAPVRVAFDAAHTDSGDQLMSDVGVLIDATNALAELQAPDGALHENADRGEAASRVEAVAAALRVLSAFPNLGASIEDLRAWAEGGYGKPDFTHSLAAFRPEQGREDGRMHLAFFPMYKQNGSPDTCFEAVLVRVPWPDWIAELEATRYDNPKFVPVELVAATRGYDSECAVLFPEQVAVAERQPNNFGAIFCDRESARLRRVATAAADLLQINLPPDAARLLSDPETSKQSYILWDLIHDRAHSHGDLPFDPFMVRQRAPYWMYSLEELRCDLTAFGEAVTLESEGLAVARNVQYAILFDRLLRFPITGPRVRNYDGLGGQLLFAYLHSGDYLRWTDNRLTFEWDRVAEGVIALRDEVYALYRSGIDRTKLRHWAAAHDLVARFVPPATGSHWVAGTREFDEVPDPRPYCDEVLPDEFPLSIFYTALQGALVPA